jgi:hypothetical protein
MVENRKHPRQRVFKAATINFNRAAGIDCTVRNISAGGACLEVASPLGIPDDFELLISANHVTHPCHVAWRSEHRIGVAFRNAA